MSKEQAMKCDICPHQCDIPEGGTGLCRARGNRDGEIKNINYGELTSLALDPVEKKPLARFHPGSMILSAGSYGCNLNCPFCQNSVISMAGPDNARTRFFPPEELVSLAVERRDIGNIGIAFTYNEPVTWYDYVLDTAGLARSRGLETVLVTNGNILPAALEKLMPHITAMNIDLKGFSDEYYRWVGGDFETVKAAIEYASMHCHVELTTLIIPGRNDADGMMEEEAKWIAGIDPEMPLHITRAFPAHRMPDMPRTPLETIDRLTHIAEKYLRYVYRGNC